MGLNFALKRKWRAAAGMLAFLMALPTLAGLLKFESKAATSIVLAGQTLTYGYYLSDGTVSDADNYEIWFDDQTGNVTLRNANITISATNIQYGLNIIGDTTVILLGDNIINNSGRTALHFNANGTIEGSGTLNVIGQWEGIRTDNLGNLTIQDDVTINAIGDGQGIIVEGTFTVGGNAKVVSEGRNTSTSSVCNGISLMGSLVVKDNCVIEARGRTYGIYNIQNRNSEIRLESFKRFILERTDYNNIVANSKTIHFISPNMITIFLRTNYAYRESATVDYTESRATSLDLKQAAPIDYLEIVPMYSLTPSDNNPAAVSTASSANDTVYYEGETVSLTQGTPNAGYEFNGWTSSEVTGITGDSFAMPAQDVTVTANWNAVDYGITYNLDGGTELTNPATYNVTTADITLNNPTKTGYTFDGWYTDATLQTPAPATTQIPAGSTGAKEFWAKYTPIDYNITYNLDGGTELTNPATYNVETAVTLNNPSKEHYTFDGWYTDANLQTPAPAAPQIPKGSTENKEFYAKFTLTEYNIDYQMNGGGDKGANPDTYNITDVITLVAAGLRTDYNFEGWFSDNNTFNNKVEQIGPNESGNKTLYAKWKYAGNINIDGTETPVIEDEVITLPTPSPVPDGYEFERWEVTPAQYTNNITDPTNPNSTFTVPGEYVSLTPKWTPIEYTITYNVGEGKNAASNPASYNIESETITLAEPTITGFYFGGWYTDAEYKNPVARIEKGSMGNRTLYAKWDEYKIIMGQGGIHQLRSGGTLSFTATGHFKDFTEVLVDSAVIDGNSYSAVEGSTVVTLTTEYLDTLSVGTHSITVRYNNGEASTTFEVQAAPLQGGGEQPPAGGGSGTATNVIIPGRGTADNVVVFTETGTGYRAPKTFDETSVMLLGGAGLAAAVSLIGMVAVIKKRREYKE